MKSKQSTMSQQFPYGGVQIISFYNSFTKNSLEFFSFRSFTSKIQKFPSISSIYSWSYHILDELSESEREKEMGKKCLYSSITLNQSKCASSNKSSKNKYSDQSNKKINTLNKNQQKQWQSQFSVVLIQCFKRLSFNTLAIHNIYKYTTVKRFYVSVLDFYSTKYNTQFRVQHLYIFYY